MANNSQFTGFQPPQPHVISQMGHPQVPSPLSMQFRPVAALPPPSFTPASSNIGILPPHIQYNHVVPPPPPPPQGQVMAASAVQSQIPSNSNFANPGNAPMSFDLSDNQQRSGSTYQAVQTWVGTASQDMQLVLPHQQIVQQGNGEERWFSNGGDDIGKIVEQSIESQQRLPSESSKKSEDRMTMGNDNLSYKNEKATSDWKVHTRDGKTFYYNRRTKVSSWKKPFELMTPTERADSTTDWREVTTPDGRRFFYNSVMKKSKWVMPDEVKLAREKANLISHEESKSGDHVYPSAANSGYGAETTSVLVSAESLNPKIGSDYEPPINREESDPKVSFTEAASSLVDSESAAPATHLYPITSPMISDNMTPQDAEPSSKTPRSEEGSTKTSELSVAVGIEVHEGKTKEQGTLTYESKEDAKNAFKALLESANIGSDANWDQAMRMIINDKRYGVLRSLGEKKQVFHEFVAQKKKQDAEERRFRQKKAREDFKGMLEEAHDLTSSTRWSKAVSIFEKDERFQAVERVKDREDLFKDHIEELKKKERAKALEDHKRHKAEYMEFLKSCDFIQANSQWRKVQHRLEEDERCSRLEKIDRLELFQEYVRDLEAEEESKRKLRTALLRKEERRNRDEFRKLLEEHVANGTLTARTHWREYCNKIKDAPAYVAVSSNTSGSTAEELFDDVIDDLEKQYLGHKEKIEDVMKSEKILLSTSWTFDDFYAALPSKIASNAVSQVNLKIIFNELVEAAKEKEEKESKKWKRLSQDIYDFLVNLKEITGSSRWEEFKALVEARFVGDDHFFQEIFGKVVSDLKEKTKDKERKRREEKSKQEKDRRNKEKESRSKHQKKKGRRSNETESDSSDSRYYLLDIDKKHHKHRTYSPDELKDHQSRSHRHSSSGSKRSSKQVEKQSSTMEADYEKQSKRHKEQIGEDDEAC